MKTTLQPELISNVNFLVWALQRPSVPPFLFPVLADTARRHCYQQRALQRVCAMTNGPYLKWTATPSWHAKYKLI